MSQRMEIAAGMRVRLKKTHPCGSDTWIVTRTGADVGMACAGCGRRVMLEREEFERRVKAVLDSPATERSRENTS
jgi:hypothetical protein